MDLLLLLKAALMGVVEGITEFCLFPVPAI